MTRALSIGCLLGSPLLSGCVVATGSNRTGGGGGSIIGFLLVPFLFFLVMGMVSRRMRGRATNRGLRETVRTGRAGADPEAPTLSIIRAELSVLADDVLRLEPEVTLNDRARNDYEAAVHRYRVATAAIESDQSVDTWRLQRVVDEATWSMSRVRAILDGRTPPPEPLARPGVRGEPAIIIDDNERPVYSGAPMSYRSGWFGGGTGMFGGLLLGSMLGGMGSWWVSDDDSEAGEDPQGIS